MSDVEVFDLREKGRSCVEHPLVVVSKIMKNAERGKKIRLLTDGKIVPVDVIRILAKKHGLVITNTSRDGEVIIVDLEKK